MKIDLTIKEQSALRHLRKSADNHQFNTSLLRTFLNTLESKLSAPVPKKTKKQLRVEKFRSMLLNHTNGNSKVYDKRNKKHAPKKSKRDNGAEHELSVNPV